MRGASHAADFFYAVWAATSTLTIDSGPLTAPRSGTYTTISWDVIGLQKTQTFFTLEPASFAALGLGVIAVLRRRKRV